MALSNNYFFKYIEEMEQIVYTLHQHESQEQYFLPPLLE